MATLASREIVDLLGAFLRRNVAALSDEDLDEQMDNLAEGRVRTPDSSRFVLSGVDASQRAVHMPVAFPEGALAAADLPPHDVHERLAHFTDYVAAHIKAGKLPRIDLPDLHRANGIYDARGNVFLGPNVRPLAFDGQGGAAFMRLLMTLETASDNLRDGVCTTKRGLFYQHQAKLPADACQIDTDRALASLANVLRVRRRALGFVEARRSLVYGRLVIRDGKEVVDLAQAGSAGRTIPRFTDDVEIVRSDAARIVIVEKESIAFRLAQTRWWDTAGCIMVCGSGFPSLSTREFVRRLIDTLAIPALVLTDADPAGIQLALTYAHGSISTALETPWLACSDLWWLGLYPSHIERDDRSKLISLTENDREAARGLLEHPSHAYVNDAIRKELAILLDGGSKVELDAFAVDGSHFVDMLRGLLDGELVKL